MFGLLRYFSITSAVALIAVTFALAYLYRDNAMEELVASAENQNVTLARSFANILWPRFSHYVMTVPETDGDKLRARPETAEIDEAVRTLIAGLPVLKVKIYNLDGRTIYSSQPGQIGADKSNNPGFLKSARAGKPASKFSFRETFSAFSGKVLDRDLVESYLPIWGDDDVVEGVFELYTDVTPLVARIDRSTDKLTAGLLITFAVLYGILFLIVRRADHIIKRQYADQLESEARFRAVVDNSPTKIHIKDAEGRYTLVNPLAEKLFGFTDEEARGKTTYDIFPKEVADAFTAHDRQVAESREMVEQVEHFTREDGEHTYLTVKFPILDGQGEVAGVAAIGTDITERKEAEEAVAKQSQLIETTFETMNQGITVYDADNTLVAFNRKFVELFDFPPGFVRTGMPIEEIVRFNAERGDYGPGDVEELVRKRIIDSDRGEINPRERTRPDGTVISARRDTMPDGGHVTTYSDITERKRAEARLGRHAKELVRSNEELEQFAYVASHDLQEPLRKVQAFGDRLRKRYSDALGEEGQDYIVRMQDAASRMQTLIQSLLNISRVATKGQSFIPVNLNELMKSILSDLEIPIQETGTRVKVANLPTIDADPSQMRQLFQNLIGNALKYRQENVPPKIELASEFVSKENGTPMNGHGGLCQIKVIDNGIGFEEQYAERIFGIFQRLHGREQYEGTGVGLAITRKIAERHGGSITANGRPGEGATFTVILPVSHPTSERG